MTTRHDREMEVARPVAQPGERSTSGQADSWTPYASPLGPLTLHRGPAGITRLRFSRLAEDLAEDTQRPTAFAGAAEQLEQYFAGVRQRFELALDTGGTPFQRAVWLRLLRIPYGTTVTYMTLAELVGRPDRLRAVAAAVGRNPVPIFVPCHRVVGADGGLTGYVGGLQRKAALLDLERRVVAGPRPEPVWAFRQLAFL
jgi:methylated-DNA-[protein]-cysteine S-methyltransferase